MALQLTKPGTTMAPVALAPAPVPHLPTEPKLPSSLPRRFPSKLPSILPTAVNETRFSLDALSDRKLYSCVAPN
jgi:hypothetical protein